jgi:hypothetical protein
MNDEYRNGIYWERWLTTADSLVRERESDDVMGKVMMCDERLFGTRLRLIGTNMDNTDGHDRAMTNMCKRK